ncbi:unnamed protein product [Rhizophagus irregularis]|nr:unnamed protein product [Rhizophagus irregularis]
MSFNTETENPNDWIEEAISKRHIKLYEYKYFTELSHELDLHRDVDYHNNVIRFCGITDKDPNNMTLVMENCPLRSAF